MSWIEEAKAEVDRKMGKATVEAVITEVDMDKLFRFQFDIDGETFRKMFTEAGGSESMAEHLWSKFHGYDHQILKLWVDLDSTNRRLVLAVINKWIGGKR